MAFRTRDQRIEIIKAIIAEKGSEPLSSFELDDKEEQFFRARINKALNALIRDTGSYKEYYRLPTEKPFSRLIIGAGAIIVICALIFLWLFENAGEVPPYPVYAALLSIAAIAAGWVVTSDISHRNTIRQNTNQMIFARFAQAPFGEALQKFHQEFGHEDYPRITTERMRTLRDSDDPEQRKVASAVSYLLNYYEFIAAGVIRGDLDARIVRENIRGVVCYYYDKCMPHIEACNRRNGKTYEHLRKIRASYREV